MAEDLPPNYHGMSTAWNGAPAGARKRSRGAAATEGGVSRRTRTVPKVDRFERKRRELEIETRSHLPNWLEHGQPLFKNMESYNPKWAGDDGDALYLNIWRMGAGTYFPMLSRIFGVDTLRTWSDPRTYMFWFTNRNSFGRYAYLHLIGHNGGVTEWAPLKKSIGMRRSASIAPRLTNGSAVTDSDYVRITPRLFNEILWAAWMDVRLVEEQIEEMEDGTGRQRVWNTTPAQLRKDMNARLAPLKQEIIARVKQHLYGKDYELNAIRPKFGGNFGPVEETIKEFLGNQRRRASTRTAKRRKTTAFDRPRDSKGRFLPMRRR